MLPWARELEQQLDGFVTWREGRTTLEFANGCRNGCVHGYPVRSHPGSVMVFYHAEHEEDVHAHQGEDINVLVLDEMTTFTEYQIRFLKGRCMRGASYLPIRFRATTNPGGVSHEYVKREYILPSRRREVHQHGEGRYIWDCNYSHQKWQLYDSAGKPMPTRVFIPSSWRDNKFIDRDAYEAKMRGELQEPLLSAYLDGNWDITTETAFPEFGNEHECTPFDLREDMPLSVGVDLGYFPDFWSVHFAAHDYGIAHPLDPTIHRVYIWGELYEQQVTLENQAVLILEKLRGSKGKLYGVAVYGGHDMARRGGASSGFFESSQETYQKMLSAIGARVHTFPAGPGSRAQRKQRLHQFLSKAPDGKPYLQILRGRAPNLVRTIPLLTTDPRDTDDVREGSEDHGYDSLTYLLSAKRVQYDLAVPNIRMARL